jgi:hypothetical protein
MPRTIHAGWYRAATIGELKAAIAALPDDYAVYASNDAGDLVPLAWSVHDEPVDQADSGQHFIAVEPLGPEHDKVQWK